ncbi:MAG: hypothetical protein HRF46_10870 [Acidobacteriota bacterium]
MTPGAELAALPSWGDENVVLALPPCTVGLEGLSRGQRQAIRAQYAGFQGTGGCAPEAHIRCRVGRLPHPLAEAAEAFTRHGEYAPRIEPGEAGVGLVGYSSLAWLERRAGVAARAALAVAGEEELAQPFVLENFLRIVTAYRALALGGVLLHSAGVVHGGRAFLFCGRANAGKTTLARKAAAAGAQVVSDDLNMVMPGPGGWWVHPVPFTGEFGRQQPPAAEACPLVAVALLEKTAALRVAPVQPAEAVAALLVGCPFVNADSEEFPALASVVSDVAAGVPVLRVGVARGDSFPVILAAVEERVKHGG